MFNVKPIKTPDDISNMYFEVVNTLINEATKKSIKNYEIEYSCRLAEKHIIDQLLLLSSIELIVKDEKKTYRNHVPSELYDKKNKVIEDRLIDLNTPADEKNKLRKLVRSIETNKYDYEYLYVVEFFSSIDKTIAKLENQLEDKRLSIILQWFTLPKVLFRVISTKPNINLRKGDKYVFTNYLYGDGTHQSTEYVQFDFVIMDSNLIQTATSTFANEKNCYIVTACTGGNIEHPYVQDFRTFRDKVLCTNHLGTYLCKIYYLISPSFSHLIANSYFLRKVSFFAFVRPLHKMIKAYMHQAIHSK